MIPNEDRLLSELEAAPTLWSAADVADQLATGGNPLFRLFERVLRKFALTTWPKKPQARKGNDSMFKVRLVIYPVGGGEEQYSLDMMVPALPRQGDYLTVLRSGVRSKDERHMGSEDFWVRRVAWMFDFPDDGKLYDRDGDGPVGQATHIYVECEYAVTAFSSQAHRENAGPEARQFGATAD